MNVRYAFFLMMLVSPSPVSICNHDSSERKSLFKATNKQREKDAIDKRNRMEEAKFFEGISENAPTGAYSTPARSGFSLKNERSKEENIAEIKSLLVRLLEKIDEIENEDKTDLPQYYSHGSSMDDFSANSNARYMPKYSEQTTIPTSSAKLSLIQRIERRRRKKDRKEEKRQRWGKWTNWSPCSVSCGKGREIRWRHCLENCDVAETEMEEKTCQLPACGPTKLFGVIKL